MLRKLSSHVSVRLVVILLLLLLGAGSAWAIVYNGAVRSVEEPVAVHVDQRDLTSLVAAGRTQEAFDTAFEGGDALFADSFNALDGSGANVGDGSRFTRVPRADLNGPRQWARHYPYRPTGPNTQACTDCHRVPAEDGAGPIDANNVRDPLHSGVLAKFIQRQPISIFGTGAKQRLAEEMTEELQAIRKAAGDQALAAHKRVSLPLVAKGISFGTISATPSFGGVKFDTNKVEGVSPDLVIRPFQWKGSIPTVRQFDREAANNELGMQAVEFVGDGRDGDYDGVVNELTVGDVTAIAVYNAAQPRPTSTTELASLGLVPAVPQDQQDAIARGRRVFESIGCPRCHATVLTIDDPIFREPSSNPDYRDAVFPGGQDPKSLGVDPNLPVSFDLTKDQPDNRITLPDGTVFPLGSLKKDAQGRAVVELFGDLKHHDIGRGLAEGIDEVGTGKSTFMTASLWGVGSTAPYLHDGRATTITEAVLEHGGEARKVRERFVGLPTESQKDLVTFLRHLVLFKQPG